MKVLAIQNLEKKIPYLYRENQYTALYTAINKGNNIIVNLLLEITGIDINYIYTHYWHSPSNGEHKYEITALSLAIQKNSIDNVRLLLSRPEIDVNLESSFEEGKVVKNHLIDAVDNENVEIVQLLLSHPNIDINAITKSGYHKDYWSSSKREWQYKSALYIACEKGNANIVQLILLYPNIDVNRYYEYEYFQDEFRQEDQKPGFQRYFRGYQCHIKKTALIVAIEKNNTEVVKALVDCQNVDVNIKMKENYLSFSSGKYESYEKSPIYLAVKVNNVENVRTLLTRPEIDTKFVSTRYCEGHTPLELAIQNKSSEIIQVLRASMSE